MHLKKIIALSFLFVGSAGAVDLNTIADKAQNYATKALYYTQYYSPYAAAAAVGSSGFLVDWRAGCATLGAASIYGLYAWYKGYKEIKILIKKYKVRTRLEDYWNTDITNEQSLLFCRWRQQDDSFGDGYYWPTAFWMNDNRKEVRKKLIQDVHAQRIAIISNGKKVLSPTPTDVIAEINTEMDMLEHDKLIVKRYTDVCYRITQPEEFHPSLSSWRIFWPNYNEASKLYIDLVVMLKRLEVLREIVAQIRAEVGGKGWPKA